MGMVVSTTMPISIKAVNFNQAKAGHIGLFEKHQALNLASVPSRCIAVTLV
jgi:hypothetical protein